MLITNQTAVDYWFGPLRLPSGVGTGTLTVDDTSATSLYLTEDAVADSINTLFQSGKVTISGAAAPFPRATGWPEVLHGDGSPEGMVYAAQGSLYLRRDKMNLFQKSSGVHFNTGWILLGDDNVKPSAAVYETVARQSADANLAILATGTLELQAIYLPAGTIVSSITCVSGATALATGVNQWFALYDQNLAKLAVTTDDTSTAWAADAAKTLTITGGFTTTYSGLHYLGILVKATTVPTLAGAATRASITGLAPKLTGASTTGLTNPASAPATAAAITAAAASIYAYTS